MEELIKDLKELGYELVYYEPLNAWKVVDTIAEVDDYLTSQFCRIVVEHGFVFSCGITLEGRNLCVQFYR